MIVLYEHTEKRRAEELKFQARLHGAEIKDDAPPAPSEGKKPKGDFVFGDPESYKDLPMEERERLTEQMMGRHKRWYQGDKPMGGKKARTR